MTEPHATTPPPAPGGAPYASWIARVGAYLIDVLPIVVLVIVMTALFGDNETTSSSFSFQLSGLPFVVYLLLALAWLLFNWGHRQGNTGQTIGKSLLGIAVHGEATHQPIGFGLSFGRYFVHILDALPCYIGFLWPLWDKENRTFADMLLSTRVYKV